MVTVAVIFMNMSRQRALGGGSQLVLDYLKQKHTENPNFYYAIQGDHDPLTANIFWIDATSRINYTYFGDTVVFDTSYCSDGYKVPFATFTGLNHHGQPTLFGCALMLDESEAAYIWLFQTWLHAMSGRTPVSITTEPARFVQMAVSQVLPNTRLRYCKWNMFRETQTHLGHVYQSHHTFEVEFRKCVDESETIGEFESRWGTLLEQYYLMDDEWMQSVYDARRMWVPVYMRDTFFGELYSDENEGRNIYFDGFITSDTTLQGLIKDYEKAVGSWHEKELQADDDTSNTMPMLKTPSPMEKQAANVYTRKIFIKFQEELVETLANTATELEESGGVTMLRVAKFGEDHRAHIVTYNSLETNASCSCQMFEFSGVICRHILAVFRAKNVLTLPSDYLLKRWTRNAKSGGSLDEHAVSELTNSRVSLTIRYDNLRQEAIKFVEEGAKSIQVYNVAMSALEEAAKKVASVKKQGHGVSQGRSLANGDSLVASVQPAEEKVKKIQELTAELDITNKRCEVYRANLLAVLKDMEDQKLKLSVKVQNARLSLKE
ncbi:protein FAR1-RELATED SEQUENCE 9-like isoform X2 [Chenopodium quinoa]|uniref:protein FAR1-RELATED SEQUENCE 9-like isoform X2 n=1 Tax=Chenopodium quinoa TaxID=63459 RepID=UPI000B79605E|nr:protein FAR1-RELATED SEQUENCE 9-like isoform X2 [Chenopodium quinoa]